jgi:hypothetical protein
MASSAWLIVAKKLIIDARKKELGNVRVINCMIYLPQYLYWLFVQETSREQELATK